MLGNLLRNVFRHTPVGTHVAVRVDIAGGHPSVQIVDDGPGIAPALQPLLFDRFGAPALRSAGLHVDGGLGLAFCKTAADALGAALAVESDGRRGTTFTIVF
jgi:two-component system OmpR family sensor kinase